MNLYQVIINNYTTLHAIKNIFKKIDITLTCIGSEETISLIITEQSHPELYSDICKILTEMDKYIPKAQIRIRIPTEKLIIEGKLHAIKAKPFRLGMSTNH